MASIKSTSIQKSRWREGEHFVWATSAALALTLLMTATLLGVVMVNGLGVLWPSRLDLITLNDGSRVMGVLTQEKEPYEEGDKARSQYKIANRDLNPLDFLWIDDEKIASRAYPEDAIVLERMEYGDFYGFLKSASSQPGPATWSALQAALATVRGQMRPLEEIEDRIRVLANEAESVRLDAAKYAYRHDGKITPALAERQAQLKEQFAAITEERTRLQEALANHTAVFTDARGVETEIELAEIVRAYQPNAMSFLSKIGLYGAKLIELLTDEPRESNTEGGLFPTIFGTVALVFLMSILSFPLGVVTGIYLREYAADGILVRIVRIAVNNLAGIPSIVYGIFGLGFFVYGVGGAIDQLFFPERLPSPTYGTGGILWASLTLGLLTVPVVIVSTEEALGAIPRGIRESSLSLGATKFQTLVRLLVPMASPGIMTGFILAMARAAGEVAPLMITGVVKLAPALPVDGEAPFVHFERKFMHLGFHIYDIAFQSPNVEAAKPMVFVTTLLLVLIVLCMSSFAIYLRNTMKKRYTITSI